MSDFIKRILSSIILLPLVFYIIQVGSFYLTFLIIILFLISYFEWSKMVKRKDLKLSGLIFLILSFYTFYDLALNKVIWIPLLICISTDVGGYVFGKIFKGPKLTKISPNKTYAGTIGGYLLSVLFISLYLNYINEEFKIYWLTIIILISSISQIGDLIISYFKRISNIKNTGNIIPGHGGLLDRIDGMIFAFPIYYFIKLNNFIF